MATEPNLAMTVRQNVMVPMRDGVRLATDLYLPPGETRPLAVILERTPYDKLGLSRSELGHGQALPMSRPQVAEFFVKHGFAVVMQDCRGRYASEGVFTKYLDEGNDGCDTLAWIAAQAWCDGRVATMGLSYGAHTQLAMACQSPPALACMFLDSGGFANAFQGGIRRGGAFELKQATWAHRHALRSPETELNPARRAALEQVDLAHWFRNLPWWPGHSPLTAAPEFEDYLFDQWHKGTFDEYWKQVGLYAEGYYDRVPDIPIAIVGSWYDPYAGACLTNYLGLAQRHQRPTCLLMGPWTHGNRSVSFSGDVDFGPSATLDGNIAQDYLHYRLAWFQQCLGTDKTSSAGPKPGVTWFEMGGGSGRRNADGRLTHGGRWRTATHWPPAGSVESQLYLAGGGSLDSTPAREAGHLEFEFDPGHPVPTVGGAITSGEPLMFGGAFDQRAKPGLFNPDQHDLAPLSERPDVLTFQTGPLAEDLVLTGRVRANLWVSTDGPDTDFTIKLIDVYPANEDYPDGFCMNIADGILRLRYRHGWEHEEFVQPDEICRVQIETLPTCNRFKAGHRLRLDISSSNFPQFDLNPNNGDLPGSRTSFRVARNRVYFGSLYPSGLSLTTSGDN
ncbi:MAG: CocE/NonD family hydrolase [Pseudomonadota bacterium]